LKELSSMCLLAERRAGALEINPGPPADASGIPVKPVEHERGPVNRRRERAATMPLWAAQPGCRS